MSILTPDGSPLNGNGNGSPAWLKAAYLLGVPSLIAIGLTYYLTQSLDRQVNGIELSLNAHIGQMERDQSDARNRDYINRMFLRQLCWNTSRTSQQARACDDIGR